MLSCYWIVVLEGCLYESTPTGTSSSFFSWTGYQGSKFITLQSLYLCESWSASNSACSLVPIISESFITSPSVSLAGLLIELCSTYFIRLICFSSLMSCFLGMKGGLYFLGQLLGFGRSQRGTLGRALSMPPCILLSFIYQSLTLLTCASTSQRLTSGLGGRENEVFFGMTASRAGLQQSEPSYYQQGCCSRQDGLYMGMFRAFAQLSSSRVGYQVVLLAAVYLCLASSTLTNITRIQTTRRNSSPLALVRVGIKKVFRQVAMLVLAVQLSRLICKQNEARYPAVEVPDTRPSERNPSTTYLDLTCVRHLLVFLFTFSKRTTMKEKENAIHMAVIRVVTLVTDRIDVWEVNFFLQQDKGMRLQLLLVVHTAEPIQTTPALQEAFCTPSMDS